VADDSGAVLLGLLRRSLMSLLSDALKAFTQSDGLSNLDPVGSAWAGSGLEDRLLDSPAAVIPANPVTGRVIDAVRKVSAINGPDAIGGLFGWDPDPVGHSRSRGIACALRLGPAGAPTFALAAAVTLDAAGNPRIDIVAKGNTADRSTVLPLDASSALSIGGRVVGGIELGLPVTGPATVARGSSGDAVRVELTRAAFAQPGVGPGIDLGAIELLAEIKLSGTVPEHPVSFRRSCRRWDRFLSTWHLPCLARGGSTLPAARRSRCGSRPVHRCRRSRQARSTSR
jgi:hypothetical protein